MNLVRLYPFFLEMVLPQVYCNSLARTDLEFLLPTVKVPLRLAYNPYYPTLYPTHQEQGYVFVPKEAMVSSCNRMLLKVAEFIQKVTVC